MAVRERKMGAATRDAYGEALVELGTQDVRVVVLDADLSKSTKSGGFAKKFPDRFLNVGIAEANMVSMAAGLATTGLIPFAHSFASFLMCKTFDQLRMGVANPRVNAKFVGSHGGISLGEDGASQMAVEDVALACALPNFQVLVPADGAATRALTLAIAAHDGPVFMRTGRPKAPVVYGPEAEFPLGGSKLLQEGRDVTIVANGLLVFEALQAADLAAEAGLSVGVLDCYSVKPLDEAAVERAARTSGALLVAEEHLTTGGLGAMVAQAVARRYPVPIEFVGVEDRYGESGTPEALLVHYGMTAANLLSRLQALVARKTQGAGVPA
ncbi:MAG: transketolase C-terminal domain-containing protein [Candidatus Sericytochromatia bacterium]|nr:transketolase C-terminal domain-containing protein [Candidatus Sericytochromatia bacterium]